MSPKLFFPSPISFWPHCPTSHLHNRNRPNFCNFRSLPDFFFFRKPQPLLNSYLLQQNSLSFFVLSFIQQKNQTTILATRLFFPSFQSSCLSCLFTTRVPPFTPPHQSRSSPPFLSAQHLPSQPFHEFCFSTPSYRAYFHHPHLFLNLHCTARNSINSQVCTLIIHTFINASLKHLHPRLPQKKKEKNNHNSHMYAQFFFLSKQRTQIKNKS